MFGFIFGSACLVALFYYLRPAAPGTGRRRRGDLRRRFVLNRVYRALETSPDQERVIRNAFEAFEERLAGVRRGRQALREGLADSLREEAVTSDQLGAVFDTQQGSLAEVKQAAASALAEVHAVLDPYQRRRLADLVRDGLRPGCRGRAA